MIEGKIVKLRLLKRDQFGRAVALVSVAKNLIFTQDIGKEILEKGLGVVYRGRDASYAEFKEIYDATETEARKRKRGIWSRPNFQTPSEYKLANKAINEL